jgi:hypothetical protein
LASIEKELQ